jgi:hypothetical protein
LAKSALPKKLPVALVKPSEMPTRSPAKGWSVMFWWESCSRVSVLADQQKLSRLMRFLGRYDFFASKKQRYYWNESDSVNHRISKRFPKLDKKNDLSSYFF